MGSRHRELEQGASFKEFPDEGGTETSLRHRELKQGARF